MLYTGLQATQYFSVIQIFFFIVRVTQPSQFLALIRKIFLRSGCLEMRLASRVSAMGEAHLNYLCFLLCCACVCVCVWEDVVLPMGQWVGLM